MGWCFCGVEGAVFAYAELFFVFVGGYFGVLDLDGVAWFCGVDLVVPEA